MSNRHWLATMVPVLLFLFGLSGSLLCSDAVADEDPPKARYDYKTWVVKVSDNSFVETVNHRLTIFTTEGAEDYGYLVVPSDRFSKVKSVDARVMDTNGKEICKRSKKDMKKICGYSGYAVYSDICYLSVDLKAPEVPYVIEYTATVEYSSLFFLREATFQHDIPVARVEFALSAPSTNNLTWWVKGMDLQPRVFTDDRGRGLEWRATDIPALDDVSYVPAGFNEPIALKFMPKEFDWEGFDFSGSTWRDIGRWYGELTADRLLQGIPAAYSNATTHDLRVAQDIYDRQLDSTRYVLISIGIGGWRPHDAAETQRCGYGDCKDLTTLLVSRFRREGFKAYPCLIFTRGAGLTDVDHPEFAFNHAITMLLAGDDTVWVDPTCANCPFGTVPYRDEDVDALVVTESGGIYRHTRISQPEDNRSTVTVDLHIDADRKARSEIVLEATGHHALWLRGSLQGATRDDTRQIIDRQLHGANEKYRVQSREVIGLDDRNAPLIVRMTTESIKPVRKLGSTLYCSPYFMKGTSGFEDEVLSDRTLPLNAYYPDMGTTIVNVTWDSSLAVDSICLPPDDSVAFDFGAVSCRSERKGDTVQFVLQKSCRVYLVTPERFEDFATYRDRFKDMTKGRLKLISK